MFIKKWIFLALIAVFFSCKEDKVGKVYATENVIIIVIDGPRKSETWNEPSRQYIPFQNNLVNQGVLYTNFSNNGFTSTMPGHTAIVTGKHENINNSGQESPKEGSIFQYWRKSSNASQSKTWIIASKDKIEMLSNCSTPPMKNNYRPLTDCGISGLWSGYREDSLTLARSLNIFSTYHPNLVLINFKEPDASAHQNDWNAYINGIQNTDKYVNEIWTFIQNDSTYKDKTALFITNDHGRHLDTISGGFASHGDDCSGCRSISLLALGPDFKQGMSYDIARDQRDIATTIGRLLFFKFPKSDGHVMEELFK